MSREPRTVLFVCTGNICRSPMAEFILRDRLGSRSAWDVKSAGTSAVAGLAASTAGVTALDEIGIDLAGHRSRPLDRESVDAASVIVVMTGAHREHVRSMFPDAAGRVFLLKFFDPDAAGSDIDDPIGLTVDSYRRIRDEIEAAMPGLIRFLDSLQGKRDRNTGRAGQPAKG